MREHIEGFFVEKMSMKLDLDELIE